MALRNDGSRLYDFCGELLIPSITVFETAERRVREKRELIADLQNEYELLENQAFQNYKNHVMYDCDHIGLCFVGKAQKWLEMKEKGEDSEGKKLDGRKKYDEKRCFEWLTEDLKSGLDIDDLVIQEILTFNYGSEAYLIKFTSHNTDWQLTIPIVPNVSMKSYQHYGDYCFKLALHHQDNIVLELVGSTFFGKDLPDIMAKGIEKYVKDGD